jgi:hypothetical protein
MYLKVSYFKLSEIFLRYWLKNNYKVKYASRIQSIVNSTKEKQKEAKKLT